MTNPNAPRRKVYAVHLFPEGYDPEADLFDDLDDTVETVLVPVLHADQLVGEREAMKMAVTFDTPQALTSVIVWAAAKRRGLFTGNYGAFQQRCLSIENAVKPTATDPTGEGEVVPPTSEPSGSASSSPTTSPASGSIGSTPTSTSTS